MTSAMENVVSQHPDVVECAVLGVPDDIKGQQPLGLIVVRKDHSVSSHIEKECAEMVRQEIGYGFILLLVMFVSSSL